MKKMIIEVKLKVDQKNNSAKTEKFVEESIHLFQKHLLANGYNEAQTCFAFQIIEI